ncbi:MAG: DUF4345 family protein [Caulobacter sp.]|nr:DUF4345 family protein [Caulobacter sp.]
MSSFGLSLVLAVIACVIGGVQGGLMLVRPSGAPGQAASAPTEARAVGGLLFLSHATAALFLGYQPSVGAGMAMALSMAWFGMAMGRGVSGLLDRAEHPFNAGRFGFELLIAVTLALPFFNPGRLVVLKGALLA